MQKSSYKSVKKDNGNAMLITTILLLVMTVLVGACINISGMQFDLSMLQRNTNNTYYLAQSGVEKEVDMINKALKTEMANNLEKIRKDFIDSLPATVEDKIKTASLDPTAKKYDNISYENGKLQIKAEQLSDELKENSYDFIESNYLNNPALNNKIFKYTVKSDRQSNGAYTEILVKAEAIDDPSHPGNPKKDSFKVTSTATSTTGTEILDTQKVEATITINLPEKVDNEIREKYEWVGNPPEILDSAITCFSDMIVTNGGKLTVYGDTRIKGSKKPTAGLPDADESGGLIVSNGGFLETAGNIYCMNNVATTNGWETGTGHYDDESTIKVSGDIIANTVGIFDDYYNGGENNSPFGPNLGIGSSKVKNNIITVDKNIFVDNDVKIERWVATGPTQPPSKRTRIQVEGSIFGISDNHTGADITTAEGKVATIDPNLSSGVFNEGINTLIQAHQMLVNGQPFITLSESSGPLKLWESIGEPFNGINTLGAYATGTTAGDKSYLSSGSKFLIDSGAGKAIKQDKIKIDNINTSYAEAYISATTNASGPVTQESKSLLLEGGLARPFFYNGWDTSITDMDSFTRSDNGYKPEKKGYIFTLPIDYYKGTIKKDSKDWVGKPNIYHKFYNPIDPNATNINQYQGLKGYMTAMRSVFYGMSKNTMGEGTSNSITFFVPELLKFESVVFLDNLKNDIKDIEWTYSNPIETKSKAISIDKYYIKEGGVERPYPSIIINTSSDKLTITTNSLTGKKDFKGIIISKGDVEIQGEINIEGAIIIGGKNEENLPKDRKYIMLGEDTKDIADENPYSPGLKLSNKTIATEVTITQNPNIILEMDFADRSYLRKVMDALKITQYNSGSDVKKILGPYNYPLDPLKSDLVSYTMGRVVLSKDSILDIKTDKIDISIKNMKKIN